MTRPLLSLAAAGAGALAYASLVEPRWYRLRHETIPALRPSATAPLRVLHLSDLHLLPGQEHKQTFVRRCLDARPDAVVVTGDILGHAEAIDPAVALLGEVGAGRLALAVLGSNDRYAPTPKNPARYLVQRDERQLGTRLDTERLMAGLREAGWQVLENERRLLSSPAGTLDMVGLGAPHIGCDHPERVDWTPAPEPVALRLGVVHAPYLRALDALAAHGADVVLAGHTHGGQLRVPVVGALVDNCDLPLRQARGLSRHRAAPGDVWLHVSAGLGASRYAPVRFACRPEASVLDLVPAL